MIACSGSVMPNGDGGDARVVSGDLANTTDTVDDRPTMGPDVVYMDLAPLDRASPRDVVLSDVPFPDPPPPEMTPQLMNATCAYPMGTVPVFDDRVELSTSSGVAAHLLRWDRTIRALPTAWIASWVDANHALHEVRIGVTGGRTDDNTFVSAVLTPTSAVVGRVAVPAGPQILLPTEPRPRRAMVESAQMPGVGLQLDGPMDRIFGAGDYLGQIAWFPTIREFLGVEGVSYGALRIDRLAPNGRTLVAGPEFGIGTETLSPQVFVGDSSVWVGFLDHTDYPPTVVVGSVNRNTAVFNGRLSVADATGACNAVGGFEAITAYDLPAAVESCVSRGIRLTIFGEFIRPDPPTPTVRHWVRAIEPGSSAVYRARVATNGREFAVVWKEAGETGLSFRLFGYNGALSPRLTIPSPENALEATFDVSANPAERGAWAVVWSTARATYLARMGRCGTNAPGQG